MCSEGGGHSPNVVEMHAHGAVGRDAAIAGAPGGLASGDPLPASGCGSQGTDGGKAGSRRLTAPKEGRPVSRKVARKLRKKAPRAAKTDKGSNVVLAPKGNAPVEIASKPRNACDKPRACTSNSKPVEKNSSSGKPSEKKPSASECKAAPALKHSFKVSLTEYKAQGSDRKEEESARACGSWANVVSRAKPGMTKQGPVKAEAHLSPVVDAIKPSPTSQKCTLDEASWPSLGGSVPRTRRSSPKKGVVKKETVAALSESDSDQRIKAILAKEPSQAVPSKTVDPASCHDLVSPQVTPDKASVKQPAVAAFSESESDSDQRIKAVVAKEPCNLAVQEETAGAASCQDPVLPPATTDKSQPVVQATKTKVSRRVFVSEDGRPISRKSARKAKRMAVRSAKADTESHVEPAGGEVKATQGGASKPNTGKTIKKEAGNSKPRENKEKENRPSTGKCKADTESDVEPAGGEDKATQEVASKLHADKPIKKEAGNSKPGENKAHASKPNENKPKGNKPSGGKFKAAPGPKQSYKINLTQFKATTADVPAESGHVGASWSKVVSTAQQVTPCAVKKVALDDASWPSLGPAPGPAKKAAHSSTSALPKVTGSDAAAFVAVSQDPASREEDRGEEQGFMPVPKKRTFSQRRRELREEKIYKNNMTKDKYLDWLERQIFEEGMLDSVSDWCIED